METIQYIASHLDEIFQAVGQIVIGATALVALTPSTRDDEILGKIVKFLELFSVVNKKTKE